MTNSAEVRSLEKLSEYLQQIETFRAGIYKEIENLTLELRRLHQWIADDSQGYWAQEYTQAQRRYSEAKEALSRCMACVREDERKPCTEEKKMVQRTRERCELCEQKLKIQRAATEYWEREASKNQAKIQRVQDLAESDLLVAAQYLRDQIEQLSEYAALSSGVGRASEASNPVRAKSEMQGDSDEEDPE